MYIHLHMRRRDKVFLWMQSKTGTLARKIFALLLWLGLIALCIINRKYISVENITAYTPGNVWLAVAILLGLFAVKSISLFIYSGILYAASGVMFSLPFALLVNLAGTVIMVSIPYWIGREAGEPIVEHIRTKYPKVSKLEEYRSGNEIWTSAIARLISILPSDPLSMYMGAVQTSYTRYLIGSLIGFLPDIITFAIIGMGASDSHSPQFIVAACAKLSLTAISLLMVRIHRHKSKSEGI